MIEWSDYILAAGAMILALVGWALKREHARIECCEGDIADLSGRLSRAVQETAKNGVADVGFRQRVEENHQALLKADEDRRGDARKIYDKIGSLEKEMRQEIQRLAEKVAKR